MSHPLLSSKKFILGAAVVIALAGTGGGYFIGYMSGQHDYSARAFMSAITHADTVGDPLASADTDPGKTVDFSSFWKVWEILDQNFVPTKVGEKTSQTQEARVDGAIQGLVNSYGDQYTVFIPKQQAVAFKDQVNGEFEGIGAVLNSATDGTTVVVATLKGSPAEAGGVLPGDTLLSVDGTLTAGVALPDIVNQIRSPKGSTVSLTVVRLGQTKETKLTVTRGVIVIPTTAEKVVSRVVSIAKDVASAVKNVGSALKGGSGSSASVANVPTTETEQKSENITVLQLSTFAKSSTDGFVAGLKNFAASDSKDLIIDLRNNPGGYLDVAVDLASYFLPKDAVVVRERTGKSAVESSFKSSGYGLLNIASSSKRVAILVNRNSASASEILSGALQDYGVAKLVGEKTYGKGSVQNLIDIGDIGSLKVTIARWFTPLGRTISGVGLTPDVVVNPSDPKYASSSDPYLDAAIDALNSPDSATTTSATSTIQ